MTKEHVIRNKPKFIISLGSKEFEIKNNGIKDFNGKYAYVNINSIEFKKERINWFHLITDLIIEFFTNGYGGIPHKDKNKIVILYNYKTIEMKLIDCDLKNAKNAVKEIKKRI